MANRIAAIRLAGRVPCDPRTAQGFIEGRKPKNEPLRVRLVEAAAELGIVCDQLSPSNPPPSAA